MASTPRLVLFVLLLSVLWLLVPGQVHAEEASSTGSMIPSAPETILTEEQARAEVSLLKSTLTRLHAGYDRFATADDLAARWQALDGLATGGTTDVELYVAVSRLLATLRCDHTKAELPKALSQWREENPSYLPLRLEFYGDRAYVINTDSEQPALGSVKKGEELLAIDDRPVAALAAEIRPLVSVDGWTDPVRDLELGYSTEYEGSAFDLFHQFLYGPKSSYRLRLVAPGGKPRTIEVRAVTYPRWQQIATPGGRRYNNFKDEVEWRFLDGDTAYLRVGTFVNYRDPVNPDKFFRPFFAELRSKKTQRLIVDLRDNGGGSTEPGLALLRFLMNEPFVWSQPARMRSISFEDLKPYLSTWDKAALSPKPSWFIEREGWWELRSEQGGKPIQPHREAFRGEVIVLIGPANSSGSTHVLAELIDNGRVRTVGGRTGGNPTGATAGILFFLELPTSGIRVRVPMQRIVLAVDSFEDGQSIVPEVEIPRTPDELFETGDRVLEAAIALGG